MIIPTKITQYVELWPLFDHTALLHQMSLIGSVLSRHIVNKMTNLGDFTFQFTPAPPCAEMSPSMDSDEVSIEIGLIVVRY